MRTALLAWLFARSSGSRFLVRMEDLDPAARNPDHEAQQLADLAALGLDWDGEVVRQSERRALYDAAIDQLTAAGLAYPCWCSRKEILDAPTAPHAPPGAYPGTCRDREPPRNADRPPSLRLRAGDVRVVVEDRLCGRFEGVVDDFVLRRFDGTPAYNLAVVVDDAAQGIGEVVRADDLLPSTPRQVHLARLLGLEPPRYAHVPLVLGPDGDRLAKRHGAVTLEDAGPPPEVLGRLAASLNLADPDEPVTPALLLQRFRPGVLPQTPWVIDTLRR